MGTVVVLPSLTAVTVSPASVKGGISAAGKVTLSSPAPQQGIVVTLADNSTITGVPSSVTVPAGKTSATFTVTSRIVWLIVGAGKHGP